MSYFKPNKVKGQDNLKILAGKFDTLTETKERLGAKKYEGTTKIRPTTTIIRKGSMDFGTVNQRDIMPVDVRKPDKVSFNIFKSKCHYMTKDQFLMNF